MPARYEMNMAKYDADSPGNGRPTESGCRCSTAVGFLLVLLAVAIAVGVGIIVHFAGGTDDVTCNYSGVPASAEMNVMTCAGLASQTENHQICDVCSAVGRPTTTTTMGGMNTTTTTMATTAPPTADSMRLPSALDPILYQLYFRPDFYQENRSDWVFNGRSSVLVSCQETTSVITMHLKDIELEDNSITVQLDDAGNPGTGTAENLYKSYSLDEDRQFLLITTTEPLIKGNNYTIAMEFIPQIRNDETGVYTASYQRDGKKIYVITTQMEATDARKAFPCFDEPAMKAQFDVTVARRSDRVALANGPLKSSQQASGGLWVEDTFERTPVMSTYLLALSISDYNYTERMGQNGIKVRLWVRPEAINQTDYGVDVGSNILSYFEDYFDIPFPIVKQDMIAINDFAFWAMENWGLIVFREDTVLYHATKTSPVEQFLLTIRLSHETSHNWFGNLVSPHWWDDLWLNEGFATFVSTIGVDRVQPDWRVMDFFVHFMTRPALISDGQVTSHPLYITGVSDTDEIMANFDNIMYEKGASVIRMTEFLLGKDTFKRGLQRYLKEHAFANAKHEDLWASLSQQAVADGARFTDVKGIMDSWVKQMNYPLVTVEYQEAGTIRLTQDRYLVDPGAQDPGKFPSDFGYTWEIPFTYTTNVESQFDKTPADVIMMHRHDSAVAVKSDTIPPPTGDNWVIGNLQYFGFFRVNYDARNWDAIIKQLNTDHTVIHSSNRAQILMDTWSLSKSGELNLVTALRASEYVTKETEMAPWNTFVENAKDLQNVLYMYPVYGAYKNFVNDILGSAYNNNPITSNNDNTTFIERYVQQLVVQAACAFDLELCVTQARLQFQQWSDGNTAQLEPAVAGTVYCTGVRLGGETEWNYVFERYQVENLRSEKFYLLQALTCTRENWLINKVMDMALEGEDIIISDFARTFEYLSYNPVAAPLVWNFFRDNFDRIFEQSGSYWGLTALQSSVTHYNTQRQIQELEEFGERVDIVSTPFYMNALAKARVTRRWLDSNMAPLTQWLSGRGY